MRWTKYELGAWWTRAKTGGLDAKSNSMTNMGNSLVPVRRRMIRTSAMFWSLRKFGMMCKRAGEMRQKRAAACVVV